MVLPNAYISVITGLNLSDRNVLLSDLSMSSFKSAKKLQAVPSAANEPNNITYYLFLFLIMNTEKVKLSVLPIMRASIINW